MTNWIIWLGMVLLSPTLELGGIVSAGTPFLLAGASLCCLQFCRRDVQISFGIPGMMAAMYFMSILISLLWSANLQASSFRVLYHVIGFVLFVRLLQKRQKENDCVRFRFWSSALTCAGAAIAADFLILMMSLTLQGRLGEAFADRETNGVMSLKWAGSNTIASALLAPLCVAMLLSKKTAWFKKLAGSGMLLAILATLSRNSSICVLGAVVAYACLSKRSGATLKAIIGIGIVAAIGFFTLDTEVYHSIIASRMGRGDVESFNGRTDTWSSTWGAIERNWPCPVGFYGSLGALGHSAHNVVLIDLFELGWWGLCAHMLLFASVGIELWVARSNRRKLGQTANDINILISGLLCIFVNLQFEDPQYTQPYIICNWVFMGLCVAASRLPTDMTTWLEPNSKAATRTARLNPRLRSKPVVGV